MKKLLTAKELRQQYRPDDILEQIQAAFHEHKDNVLELFLSPSSPLNKYNQRMQLSILDEESFPVDNTLAKDLVNSLNDAIFFMTLSKSERTKVTQKLRSFEAQLIENQLSRINLVLEDEELGSPTPWTDERGQIKMTSSHHGIDMAFEILSIVKKDLEDESKYWKNVSRSGYLTGLQISMGGFFNILQSVGMAQKDQITLVQQLFDLLKVDWDEGERENIKVSLQQPALAFYHQKQKQIEAKQALSTYPRYLTKDIVNDISELSANYKSRLRRF